MEYVSFCNKMNKATHGECIIGNSLDIEGIYETKEIRGDIQVEKIKGTTIWGQIKDNQGKPISGECVKLVKIREYGEHTELEVVASTVTDVNGNYQLDAYGTEEECYTVLVNRKEPDIVHIPNRTHIPPQIQVQEACNEQAMQITPMYPKKTYIKNAYAIKEQGYLEPKYKYISRYVTFSR